MWDDAKGGGQTELNFQMIESEKSAKFQDWDSESHFF